MPYAGSGKAITTAGKSSFLPLPGFSLIKFRQAFAVLANFLPPDGVLSQDRLLPKHQEGEWICASRQLNHKLLDQRDDWKWQTQLSHYPKESPNAPDNIFGDCGLINIKVIAPAG